MTPLSSPAGCLEHSRRDENMLETNPRSHALRIASYIRVVDLAKSYNINVEKMKTEIERMMTSKTEADGSTSGTSETAVVEGKDDSHSLISKVTDDSGSSAGEKKLREVVASKGYPKRFSAMNGGFNLCL